MANRKRNQIWGCKGKAEFETYTQAEAAARRARNKEREQGAYRCRFCPMFHVGKDPSRSKQTAFKRRKQRLIEAINREDE